MAMRFRVNGITYNFDFGAVTGRLATEVREAIGSPVTAFIQPPYDAASFAVMAYCAERAAKKRANLDAMLDTFTMDAILKGMAELSELDAAEEEAAPPTEADAAFDAVAADPEGPGATS